MQNRLMPAVAMLFLAVPVWGQSTVFYDDFETGDTSAWWAPARVGETGQTACYDEGGSVIGCAGTGQDGDVRPGVAWPRPRFVDNGDGTVTDKLAGLVWLRNTSCFVATTWVNALAHANTLASGTCGLADDSMVGDWRLPSVNELQSLTCYEYSNPALSNAAGTGSWTEGDAFFGVQSTNYWSSTSYGGNPALAWVLTLNYGLVQPAAKTITASVWPVRRGQ